MDNPDSDPAPGAGGRPLLLLDIDGVLNAFAARLLDRRHHAVAEIQGYRIVTDRRHPGYIGRLQAHFEIVWATMWQDQAPAFGAAIGIGAGWDYIDFSAFTLDQPGFSQRTGYGVGSHKWPGVLAYGGSRPLVWIDDDIEPWQHRWAEDRHSSGLPTLFVQPDPTEGLTGEQVDAVLAFAAALARDRSAPQP